MERAVFFLKGFPCCSVDNRDHDSTSHRRLKSPGLDAATGFNSTMLRLFALLKDEM